MTETILPIDEIINNPWHFRIMYTKDFDSLVDNIKKNGLDIITPPIIANIDSTYFIVDGHSRIHAAKQAGLKKIHCKIAASIKNYSQLRIHSFKMNKEGYSNPLLLSDMFYEDLQILKNIQNISEHYNVHENYIKSILKLRDLHDDTKSLINKIIDTAKRKYQFILQQITPDHLSALAELPPSRQVEIADWILKDIIYGPTDESLVSIPSIYEINEEISETIVNQRKTTYRKKHPNNIKLKEFPMICRCGAKYEINVKSNSIFELVEKNNMILKKKFDRDDSVVIYSTKTTSKKEIIELVKRSSQEIKIIFNKDDFA